MRSSLLMHAHEHGALIFEPSQCTPSSDTFSSCRTRCSRQPTPSPNSTGASPLSLSCMFLEDDHESSSTSCDSLIAFAGASRLYDWARPVMTEDAVCKIIKCVFFAVDELVALSLTPELSLMPDIRCRGRHPLAELCVDTFVPNHTSLVSQALSLLSPSTMEPLPSGSDEFLPATGRRASFDQAGPGARPRAAHRGRQEHDHPHGALPPRAPLLHLLAHCDLYNEQGANFSGKSVYLKQVALITFLAHIGTAAPFLLSMRSSATCRRSARRCSRP